MCLCSPLRIWTCNSSKKLISLTQGSPQRSPSISQHNQPFYSPKWAHHSQAHLLDWNLLLRSYQLAQKIDFRGFWSRFPRWEQTSNLNLRNPYVSRLCGLQRPHRRSFWPYLSLFLHYSFINTPTFFPQAFCISPHGLQRILAFPLLFLWRCPSPWSWCLMPLCVPSVCLPGWWRWQSYILSWKVPWSWASPCRWEVSNHRRPWGI